MTSKLEKWVLRYCGSPNSDLALSVMILMYNRSRDYVYSGSPADIAECVHATPRAVQCVITKMVKRNIITIGRGRHVYVLHDPFSKRHVSG